MSAATVIVERDALAILIDAARTWADEIDAYIIPSAEESSAEDAAGYHTEAQHLEDALERTLGKLALGGLA